MIHHNNIQEEFHDVNGCSISSLLSSRIETKENKTYKTIITPELFEQGTLCLKLITNKRNINEHNIPQSKTKNAYLLTAIVL